jgi:hypothetical protein
MHAPSAICSALYRLNPSARLAWAGEARKSEGELNAGSFALVQLYPAKTVGPIDAPYIPNELWYTTVRPDEHGQATIVKIDRGPIFNRYGGTTPDWDMLAFVPVYVARFKDYKMSNEAVQSGAILPLLQRWMQPLKKRVADSQEQAGRELKKKAREIGEEAGKRLWREALKSDATSPIVPYDSSVRKEMDGFFKANDGLENYYRSDKVFR